MLTKLDYGFQHIVLQPTSLCNLNCEYCYLPARQEKNHMSPAVTAAIAESITHVEQRTQVLWHGGEPFAAGVNRFRDLIEPFESLRHQGRVYHTLQTNATLISDKWCEVIQHYKIGIGVSIDGTRDQTNRRVDWHNRSAYERIMRGIDKLKEHKIPFRVIAVVSKSNIENVAAFYDFFKGLGCISLALNVEELEGLYRDGEVVESMAVQNFWSELYRAWAKDPVLNIREIDRALGWILASSSAASVVVPNKPKTNLWPTVATNGDVVVVAPELMAARKEEIVQFVVGNVLDKPFTEIVQQARQAWYVQSFMDGVRKCRTTCPYFSFCGGGHASNKYFETGRFDTTETKHCRNHEILVVEGVLAGLGV